MGLSRYLVGCVAVSLLAGCVGSSESDLDADDMNLVLDTAEGPSLPVAPAGSTCALIQRGTLGQVQDTDIGFGNGPNWAAGAYPFTWTGISPYDHRSVYQFDISVVPAGSNVVLATFTTYVSWNEQSSTVRAHRITAPWSEATATFNNFGGAASWDPAVLGSFNPGGVGYRSLDVTGLAQSWHSGAAANNGLLLEEDPVLLHNYFASEVSTVSRRPSLYVCWLAAPPPVCHPAGGVCEINSNCCDGLSCVSGACAVPFVCGNAGASCGDDGACCAGLVCNSGSCGTPPPVCSPPDGLCNANTPCCNGAICNDGVCPVSGSSSGAGGAGAGGAGAGGAGAGGAGAGGAGAGGAGAGGAGPVCSQPGGDCNADHPCCDGICNDGVCPGGAGAGGAGGGGGSCSEVASLCSADSDCCSGACFDGVCVATDMCMGPDELGCSPANPCCDGGHCAFNICFAAEDFTCSPPGALCGDGCCWGMLCSSNGGDGVCVPASQE